MKKLQLRPEVATPGELQRIGKPYGSPLVHQWFFVNRRFVITRKPFFRAFDGCWYVQFRLGGKRKQVKLLDESRDKEAEAYQAFFRLMAQDPNQLPEPSSLKVSHACDLFLTAICPYAGNPL
jgi:hypothetical protein